jgi:hypothetical protein
MIISNIGIEEIIPNSSITNEIGGKIFYNVVIKDKPLFERLYIQDIWNNNIKKINYVGVDNNEVIIRNEELHRLLEISNKYYQISNIKNKY